MVQTGILVKIIQKWTKTEEVDCLNPESSKTKAIDMKMVITAFILLSTFFIIASIIAFFEKMEKKFMKMTPDIGVQRKTKNTKNMATQSYFIEINTTPEI